MASASGRSRSSRRVSPPGAAELLRIAGVPAQRDSTGSISHGEVVPQLGLQPAACRPAGNVRSFRRRAAADHRAELLAAARMPGDRDEWHGSPTARCGEIGRAHV